MDGMKAAGGVLVICLFLALRFFAWNQMDLPNPEEMQAIVDEQAAVERAARLASQAPYIVNEASEDFMIFFPDKPGRHVTLLMGNFGPAGSDIDWNLNWLYDSTFSIDRKHADERLQRDDPTIPYDRWFVANVMKRMVDWQNLSMKGKPEAWKVQNRKEFTFDGKYPAIEFTYTYQKVFNEAGVIGPNVPMKLVGHDRAGRCWIVKVPGTYYILTVDGEPDVPQSALANSFFNSFSYTPPVEKGK
jgi:hypothetical protein